ncbi:hypothetical protein GALMADRAFT_1128247 [Galerina marginata CBS 339.88]|uniref:Uncharacterized protein n=1 Tax=Galerina marginata (strain CBS 339.88) TaxID=685588 RepID=A0A067S8W7_GALM3|nr:hypothetical protein GALMADRAFT_1128247 [Galerina marginata CBS 339.88]
MVLKTPFIQCLHSIMDASNYSCGIYMAKLLIGLKKSGFSNTEELYLFHRGVWDKILHERLSKIKSGPMVDTIISSAFFKRGVINPVDLAEVLAIIFDLEIPLMVDDPQWLKCTLWDYIGPSRGPEYQALLLEFLADPIRAGKYILDGTKFATLTKTLLGFLIQTRNDEKYEELIDHNGYEILGIVEEIIPRAGPSPELVEMLNNLALIFPNQCRSHICYVRLNKYEDLTLEDLTRDFQVTVRTLANYLMQVCGSVPPGFRITVRGSNGEEDTSYYYDADSDDK